MLSNGFWLFCSIAVLPAFILPVSPLLILAGKWGGTHSPWLSCLYSVIALAVNLSWTYWFARKPEIQWSGGFSPVKAQTSEKDPKTSPNGPSFYVLPGRSFHFHQLYFGNPENAFSFLSLISLPILSLTSCGYVLIFAGVFGGEKVEESAERWAYALGGVGPVVAMTLLGRIISRKKAHAN